MRKKLVKKKAAIVKPRDKNGRYLKGVSGNLNGRPRELRLGDTLAQVVTDTISIPKLAKRLIAQSYDGDPSSVNRVCTMIEHAQARRAGSTPESALDFKLLTVPEMKVLRALMLKGRGEVLTTTDAGLLAKLDPRAALPDEPANACRRCQNRA